MSRFSLESLMTSRSIAVALCAASFLATACGPELTPISEVESLRIIGVRKSASYAQPGEKVQMQMLWEDGRDSVPDDVDIFFGFWCLNPLGDTYVGCLNQSGNVQPQFAVNQSNFELTIPEDSLQPSVLDTNLPDYGTAVVFYGICNGTLDVSSLGSPPPEGTDLGEGVLPTCKDADGAALGPDDFIVGFSKVFIYEELRNENPRITGIQVDGKDVAIDCIDEDCDGPFPPLEMEGCEEGIACIESCEEDGDFTTCPEIALEAVVDRDSAELDALGNLGASTELEEFIWVSYLADRGRITPPLKLVNDARSGWNPDLETSIYAPKEKGPMRIWAVARDNRGGASWIRIPAYVK